MFKFYSLGFHYQICRGLISKRHIFISRFFKMELKDVVCKLETFAPTSLAEKWDNVGLLVEPTGEHTIKSILLTNDLTEQVLNEAVEKQVNMVISYHPPIFVPLKRLTSKSFKERIVIKAIEHRIAIYSPHTAFDAVHNGVNDWLAEGLGDGMVTPLHYSTESCIKGCSSKVTVETERIGFEELSNIRQLVNGSGNVLNFFVNEKTSSFDDKVCNTISWYCSENAVLPSISAVRENTKVINIEVTPLSKVALPHTGSGRLCTLSNSVSLSEIINRVKRHLNLPNVRLATSPSATNNLVSTIGLCAGSGASVLKGIKADVYLTGEMSHHEVLDAVSRGIHVILCEHSNTERGFLKVFKEKLHAMLDNQVKVIVSEVDDDPLRVV